MTRPRLVVAADHGGAELMSELAATSSFSTAEVVTPHPVAGDDYPRAVAALAARIRPGSDDRGVMICRSGVGMALAANRFKHLRAVHAHDVRIVKRARRDEDVNVLSLGADFLDLAQTKKLVATFLRAPFRNTVRDRRRLRLIDSYVRAHRR